MAGAPSSEQEGRAGKLELPLKDAILRLDVFSKFIPGFLINADNINDFFEELFNIVDEMVNQYRFSIKEIIKIMEQIHGTEGITWERFYRPSNKNERGKKQRFLALCREFYRRIKSIIFNKTEAGSKLRKNVYRRSFEISLHVVKI